MTKRKTLKLGDLGIAKVLNDQSAMATTVIGTPYYMSPELFSNRPYDFKSDVWALGCCVYEMATLKHAFNGHSINSLINRVVNGQLPVMPRSYTPQLLGLIEAMLKQSPDKRPTVAYILSQLTMDTNLKSGVQEVEPEVDIDTSGDVSLITHNETEVIKKVVSTYQPDNFTNIEPLPVPVPPNYRARLRRRLKKDGSTLQVKI